MRQHLFSSPFSKPQTGILSRVLINPLYLFSVFFLASFIVSCEKTDNIVVDSTGVSPIILSAFVTPSTVNTDTINIGTERKPDDVLLIGVKTYATIGSVGGLEGITAIARIIDSRSTSAISSVILLDDGNGVDSTNGDGVFSGWNTFEIVRSEIATFRVEIVAENHFGYTSNTHVLPLTIVRLNQPPVLSNLQAPDTIRLSSQTLTFLLTVQAGDPDGVADIRQVIFNSFLPGGQPSSSNPFRMYDDGTNGDAVSGNGIYSLQIGRPSNPGQYRFEFHAFDRSNATSNSLIHTITVVP